MERHRPWGPCRLALVAASAFALAAACGGSSASIGDTGGGDVDAAAEPDAAPAQDGSPPQEDASSSDAGADVETKDAAGPLVTEKPSPDCHDLAQVAPLATPIGSVSAPPTATPLTAITPGRYVAKSITDYGGAAPIDATPSQTTVEFTSTREYYTQDEATLHRHVTLDWTLADGVLTRVFVCPTERQGSPPVKQRIDASPNGFTIYVPRGNNRVEAIRYESMP